MEGNIMSSNIANDNVVLRENIQIVNAEVVSQNEKKSVLKEKGYQFVKRTVDIIGGLVGTILLVPITIAIGVGRMITKENDGPIFYEQLRIGKNGKQFRLYKYRSMVIDADRKLEEYLAQNEEARKEYKKYKKLKHDPRITKVGDVIRKFSIDEFPQFINVLKGDMSLVGPRPYLPREREDMGENYDTIVTVKPGITGYWQVNGRNDIDFEERTQMDIAYIHDKCLWFDFKLLVKTFLRIFKKEGA